MKMLKYVRFSFNFPWIHYWPKAPENATYLAIGHYHYAKVNVWISVKGDDREIEFHQCQQMLQEWVCKEFGLPVESEMSCEQLAKEIANQLLFIYPGRWVRVEVWEDETFAGGVEVNGTKGKGGHKRKAKDSKDT